MKKEQVLSKIKEDGTVAVVRADSSDQAKRIADASIDAVAADM
ncbi:MAG TPA: bifunctional 2-keto-4-hydroxyglutarate aldolase/2-keto-3-deoxy-6-phosphogluconate aldolase, partial [Firmicutes bacterium]|nr:bifunctional 2-keto-4-hydroxyglutarate aldolase/2-keto-3-deoxy-6-phosphogluconate aldolase [Bacillota bacterium]